MSRVNAGATNVTRNISLILAADGSEATGLTVTDLNMVYTRLGSAPAAKVDATDLGSTGAAHSDNGMYEIDGTDAKGLYRMDWPDAAFITGVDAVTLTISGATIQTATLEVTIDRMMTLDTIPDTGVSFQKMMARIYAWAMGKSPTGLYYLDPTGTYKRVEAADATGGTRPTTPAFIDTDLP